MGNVCKNNSVQPLPSKMAAGSSRSVMKKFEQHYSSIKTDGSEKSKAPGKSRKPEPVERTTSMRTDSERTDPSLVRRRLTLAKTFLRTSMHANAMMLHDCQMAAAAASLGHNVAHLIQTVHSMHLLSEEEKKFVLEDVEKAQLLTCSNDEADNDDERRVDEMTNLLKELLNSYQETSVIQSSKDRRLTRLKRLLAALQDPSIVNHPDEKTQLLDEMKQHFLRLLSCHPDDDLDEEYC